MGAPDTSGAVDIQAAPVDQTKPSSPEKDKQNYNIGPREPQKEKPLGVWVDFFQSKKMSVGCGLSLQPKESLLHSGQSGTSAGLSLGADTVRGCVGFKYSFR
jgi:hypothetical protein